MDRKKIAETVGSYLLLALLLCVLAYTSWGVSLFIHKPINIQLSLIEPAEFWPGFFIGIGAFAGFVWLRGWPRNLRLFRAVFIGSALWLLLEFVRIFTLPSAPTLFTMTKPWTPGLPFSFLYSFPLPDMLMDVGTEIIFLCALAAVLLYVPDLPQARLFQSAICWGFVLLALVSVFFTFLPGQAYRYGDFFDHFINGDPDYAPIQSFYWQKNVYGFFLFMGMLAAIVINERRRFAMFWPLVLFFAVMNVFAVCKTVILISAVLLPVYFFLGLARDFKKHKVRSLVLLGSTAALAAAAIATFYVLLSTGTPMAINFLNALSREFSTGDLTMDLRSQHWLIAIGVNGDLFRMVFGYGFMAGEEISLRYQQRWMRADVQRTSHSVWVDIYLRYGALGLLAELVLVSYLLYLVYLIWKKERWRLAPGLVLVLLAIFVYSLDESKGIFYRDTNSWAFLAVAYLPAAVYSRGFVPAGVLSKARLAVNRTRQAPVYLSAWPVPGFYRSLASRERSTTQTLAG